MASGMDFIQLPGGYSLERVSDSEWTICHSRFRLGLKIVPTETLAKGSSLDSAIRLLAGLMWSKS